MCTILCSGSSVSTVIRSCSISFSASCSIQLRRDIYLLDLDCQAALFAMFLRCERAACYSSG